MLLKDLAVGKRFMFDDKKTPLALTQEKAQHTAAGTFELVRFGENGCPVLRVIGTSKEITVVANTAYRWILVIF